MRSHTAALAGTIAAAASMPVHAGDCTTEKLKVDAAYDSIEEHYHLASSMVVPVEESPELIELDFGLDDFKETWCAGRVRIADDCGITDAEGAPLSTARAREHAFDCTR